MSFTLIIKKVLEKNTKENITNNPHKENMPTRVSGKTT